MTSTDAQFYEVRIEGRLDPRWSAWFENLAVIGHQDGTTTLAGPVADQAQLHGILARLRDLGATLISLHAVAGGSREPPADG